MGFQGFIFFGNTSTYVKFTFCCRLPELEITLRYNAYFQSGNVAFLFFPKIMKLYMYLVQIRNAYPSHDFSDNTNINCLYLHARIYLKPKIRSQGLEVARHY